VSSPSTEGRLKAFRLSDVPETVRLRALDVLLATEGSKDGMLVASGSLSERLQLGFAAERPSDRVYWVSASAWEKAARRREWKTG
jgi:hypothetical protein